MFELDHIAVAGETLDAAVAHSEAALGVALLQGGQHTHYATHNRLLGLADGLYFEAIAVDPSQPRPAYARWFGLDDFAGPARLDKWILRCRDIDAAHAAFPEAGSPVRLSRGALHWTMLVPEDGRLPFDGMFPAIIQWHSDTPPGDLLERSGLALTELRVAHPKASALAARLAGVFEDRRVVFQDAPVAGLTAGFDSATGPRRLA